MSADLRLLLDGMWRGLGAFAAGAGRIAAYALIWAYRLILKPLFPASCRFEPSCSEYALQAVRRFGIGYGGWLALRRLGRCNPWGPWGSDPVPETRCAGRHSSSTRHARLHREHP